LQDRRKEQTVEEGGSIMLNEDMSNIHQGEEGKSIEIENDLDVIVKFLEANDKNNTKQYDIEQWTYSECIFN
jgi:hypothetical protein